MLGLIGQGGMGFVYKLRHPNIVTIFEHGESGGFFYLTMESA